MAVDGFAGWSVDVRIPIAERPLELMMSTTSSSVAIVGPSGAGKSTLLRVLAGVERRASGRVVVDGRTWLDPSGTSTLPPWKRDVGWVPQEAALFPHLSVRENLGYAGATGSAIDEVARLLEVDRLLERRPRRLSGGERQRVSVGRALLARPRLLLLDEPFSALDRTLRLRLARLLRSWSDERGIPLVLVSHDEHDTDVLAEEHWHLNDGVLSLGRASRPGG